MSDCKYQIVQDPGDGITLAPGWGVISDGTRYSHHTDRERAIAHACDRAKGYSATGQGNAYVVLVLDGSESSVAMFKNGEKVYGP